MLFTFESFFLFFFKVRGECGHGGWIIILGVDCEFCSGAWAGRAAVGVLRTTGLGIAVRGLIHFHSERT